MEYFEQLGELLRIERDEDLRSYLIQTETSPVAERRLNGLSWYPIAIRGTEMSRGDYLTVEIERTTHQDLSYQFRFGSSVSLFSNFDPNQDRIEGTVTYLNGNKLKMTLRTDELPDWCDTGKLGIDLLFDNNSYDEMQHALKQAATRFKESQPEDDLISVLTGQRNPTFAGTSPSCSITGLNTKQITALDKIIQATDLAIVHGPPGTGKTTTLIHAIKELIRQEKQILVVAPSNTAVDLLSERLASEGLNVLRIGNPARVSDTLLSLTLDHRISNHHDMRDVKTLRKRAVEFRNMAHKYKRNYGRAEQEQRKALFNEAHKLMKEVSNTEQYITDQIIAQAQIITATLVGANHYTIRNCKFKTVVIDEAGQALEPACWIPILKAKKVVLAGDHCQLPPTVKSKEASERGLTITLMEKLVARFPEAVVLLEEQYRMNEKIMGYPSAVFYNNKLRAASNVAKQTILHDHSPFMFIDTAGCGFDEKNEGTSITNSEEALFLLQHLTAYISDKSNNYLPEKFPSIGIISPYQQQVKILKELLRDNHELGKYAQNITVNTVDSFQGQERDIVYISLVRSNAERVIGFLADIRRANVAMTRARKKLVIIGDSTTLSRLPFYTNLIAYAEKQNAYHSAWEFLS